ncbi:MAG TPA: alpha/beta fold hydrolase [Actinomycetota bacterium]|nr:alpha/beta fold hydrolase [Actinomycetota bacterium]
MRARYPDGDGFVERDGVKLFFEVFGDGDPTVFLLPTWSIIHSRFWKMQIPYLYRHFRVVTFDGRGNGQSDRPTDPEAYAESEFVAVTLAVMDATNTDEAVLVSVSLGAQRALMLAAGHPRRVKGAVFIAPSLPLSEPHPERAVHSFDEPLETDEGWARFNRHFWLKDFQGFLEFFFASGFSEPHSTKPIEDCVVWGLETTPETLIATARAPSLTEKTEVLELAARVECPVLVIHGDEDAISPHERGASLAESTGGTLVTLEGSGHFSLVRDPVKVNLLLRDFTEPRRPRNWTRGRTRRKRALLISSPIGLGHAQRDVAIARELRALVPELQIDWLAQDPVTRVLESEGERIHPASSHLASESRHIERASPPSDDIVPDDFGLDLPNIRDWTEEHYSFSGYITGFDPHSLDDVAAIRAELGYSSDEKVCIVTVGGSGVGEHLLRRVARSFETAKTLVPELRMILVAGPRIDPGSLPHAAGLEVLPYVHNLYRHLAVCDLAIVQGGLTTAMELTANQRPFLYFPLRHHFEQNFHVRHRLERYRAGTRMDFDEATPETIATSIANEIGSQVDYKSVEADGAKRAAGFLAELL